ncbi:MAG: nucleotide-binding protein [Bacilli bacterium]
MYYHLIIEVKPEQKNEKKFNVYVYNQTKEQIIHNFAQKYIKGENFIANGYSLDKSNTTRFKIVSSQLKIEELASQKSKQLPANVIGFYRKEDIVTSDSLVIDETQNIFDEITEKTIIKNQSKIKDSNCVFIVHGHDINKITEVENFVRSIGFEPIVLFKETDIGETIIEKIEKNSSKSIYGIVIYTKCDEGYEVGHEIEKKFRARQNVVFEHGYLMAKLGRDHVCAILEDDTIETPGDISGIIYKRFDNNGLWKYDIAKSMSAVGIKVDLNRIK